MNSPGRESQIEDHNKKAVADMYFILAVLLSGESAWIYKTVSTLFSLFYQKTAYMSEGICDVIHLILHSITRRFVLTV